jgi:hypothetical protein
MSQQARAVKSCAWLAHGSDFKDLQLLRAPWGWGEGTFKSWPGAKSIPRCSHTRAAANFRPGIPPSAGHGAGIEWRRKCPRCGTVLRQAKLSRWECPCGWHE